MKTQKMNIKIVGEKLSRSEMKNIMAGSGTTCPLSCSDPLCGSGCFCYNHLTANEYCGSGR